MATLSQVASAIENWAPSATAESYDNVGLLLGRPESEIARGIVALDLTPAVVQEAIDLNAQIIVTHHPPIFKPLRSITSTDFVGSMLLRLAEHGIGVYSAHTNLDAARDGVSFELATRLGLSAIRMLEPASGAMMKLVTFVPASHAESVRNAMAEAGAGRIGNYDRCSFMVRGTGTFRAGTGANPTIGTEGSFESVEEVKLEMEVEESRLKAVVAALTGAHPYEEVAYDVFRLHKPSSQTGMGAVGELAAAEGLFAFLERVRVLLNSEGIRFTGSSDKEIRRVAVCGGSGGSLISAAMNAGADVLVTADLSYHRFFEVLDSAGSTRMALVDAGHYETEAHTEELLAERLSEAIPDVRWEATGYRTSPIGTYP
ncbi:MAG: Nif3-like dinuclear metal center hexameric protein [Bacteroidetes bacterium]|nr:Nif3-like dinuclear metal center hexameric protein [Bacteroidota bacterium]